MTTPTRFLDSVTFFASGSNQSGEVRALSLVEGAHLGTVASRVRATTPATRAAWAELLTFDGSVFIDSGAFEEVDFNVAPTSGSKKGKLPRPELPVGIPFVSKPLGAAHWETVFDVYGKAADALGERAYLVAPDFVAFQAESLERLEAYAERCIDLWERGANVLVPLQKGELSLADYHRRAVELFDGASFIPSIPMKKDATDADELLDFVREVRPSAIHLLGLGADTKKAGELVRRILEVVPFCQVSCDACLATRWAGRANGPKRADGTKGPRRYTELSDLFGAKLAATAAADPELAEVIAANETHLRKTLAFFFAARTFWTDLGLAVAAVPAALDLPADVAAEIEPALLPLALALWGREADAGDDLPEPPPAAATRLENAQAAGWVVERTEPSPADEGSEVWEVATIASPDGRRVVSLWSDASTVELDVSDAQAWERERDELAAGWVDPREEEAAGELERSWADEVRGNYLFAIGASSGI